MSVSITVQMNVGNLVSVLEESFPSTLNGQVSFAMQQVGYQMQTDAQMRAPRRTGYMANQISFEPLGYSAWAFRLIGRAPYTIYQEFGTRYIPPHLFITMAVQIYLAQMVDAIKNGVDEAISEAFS